MTPLSVSRKNRRSRAKRCVRPCVSHPSLAEHARPRRCRRVVPCVALTASWAGRPACSAVHRLSMNVSPVLQLSSTLQRLECTPTSLLHYSGRCRQTKQDAVRKPEGVPSQWPAPTYGTVFPPPSVAYHRLPPSLPSCAQDTSVPLSI